MKIFYKIFLSLIIFSIIEINAQDKSLPVLKPVDQSNQDKSLTNFKRNILKAIDKKDTNFIISVLDTNILNSFGGNGGIQELREMWKLENPNSCLWIQLKKVFLMGGTFIGKDKKMFSIPYVFSEWPEEINPYKYVVVLKKNINLRENPSTNSRILKKLSYNILELIEAGTEINNWSKVMTQDSIVGFIYSDFIRSPIDYRVILKKENGKWIINSFITGD